MYVGRRADVRARRASYVVNDPRPWLADGFQDALATRLYAMAIKWTKEWRWTGKTPFKSATWNNSRGEAGEKMRRQRHSQRQPLSSVPSPPRALWLQGRKRHPMSQCSGRRIAGGTRGREGGRRTRSRLRRCTELDLRSLATLRSMQQRKGNVEILTVGAQREVIGTRMPACARGYRYRYLGYVGKWAS
jgi:hypothetical protein